MFGVTLNWIQSTDLVWMHVFDIPSGAVAERGIWGGVAIGGEMGDILNQVQDGGFGVGIVRSG